MKKDTTQDERVLSERRIIQSRGYSLIVMMLIVSIVVQQYIMRAPFAQYAVEWFIFLVCGFYNIIATYKKGIDIHNPRGDSKKQILFTTLISGVLSVVIFAVLTGNYQIANLSAYLVSFVAFFFIFRLVTIEIMNKKLLAINKDLSDEENNE